MKLGDYAETKWFDDLCDNDRELLAKEINLDLYFDLQNMARDTCNLLVDDQIFCKVEWNLFKKWYTDKGFTEDDWQYVEACGYERDQFENEEE